MLEAYGQLQDMHDVLADADRVLEKDIGVPTCIPNCGLCCIHNVPGAMTLEGTYAVSVLTGSGRLSKIKSIAEGWLLERHPFATLYEGMPRGFASPKLREEWTAVTRSECPFLDLTNKLCLIHDCRPLACRAYGITRDAADICPRPLGRGESESERRYIKAPEFQKFISDCRREWQRKNKAYVIGGPLPTIIYRAAEPEKFREYVRDNKIASAKIIGVDIDTSLMWQPQLDALRAGKTPDLVVSQ